MHAAGNDDLGLRLGALAAAWLAGVGLQLQRAELASLLPLALLGGGAALSLLIAWRRRLLWLALAALAIGGFATTELRALARLSDALAPGLEGVDLLASGRIASLPRESADGLRFVFELDEARRDGVVVQVPRRIQLGWWDDEGRAPLPRLVPGERWRFVVRLRAPHGLANPHGFDAELWLFEQGLRATGSVRAQAWPAPQRLEAASGETIDRLRLTVRERIALQVPDARRAGVLAALAVGDQQAIERDDWALFRATGVAHLMAISGLHVTMLAWLAGALIGALWRRSARLAQRVPAPLAGAVGGLACAFAYALLAGWGVPAQRTVWMLAATVLLPLAGIAWPWPLRLQVAALVVALLDPWALLQAGFWLSFAAVGLLLASHPRGEADAATALAASTGAAQPTPLRRLLAQSLAALRSGVRTQAIATIGLAPLSLLFFRQLSVVGFAANLVAIPLVTLLVTPLALLGVVAPPLWTAAAWLLGGLDALLGWLAALPFAQWHAAAAPWWAQWAGLVGGAIAVLPLPWRLRLLALPLLLPLIDPPLRLPEPGRFELLAADIGQGSALLLRTRNHALLFDAGPAYWRGGDAGERVLLPLLRAQGVRRLDMMVLSHADTDHIGGAASLLAALPTAALLGSLPATHALRSAGVPFQPCLRGQHWQWDGVRFEVLHPFSEAQAASTKLKSNARSCVLRVADAAGDALLLTGDIEAAQEAQLVAAERERAGVSRTGAAGERAAPLRSSILVAPHHGSRSSSSAAFIDAVAPSWVVVQAGYGNRFGHPAATVVERYALRAVDLRRSDACGAFGWRDGAPRCQRDEARRYWQHMPPR